MADASFQVTAEQRARVKAFQREHHLGLLALVFTDLVSSLRLKQQLGDFQAVALMKDEQRSVRLLLSGFTDGEEIGTAGDSFFVVFARPSDAVRFALLLHAGDRELCRTAPQPLTTRIGIHVGEVLITEGDEGKKGKDIFGMQVDACARIMGLAEGGQTLLSRFAFDNARQVLSGRDLSGIGALAWVNHGTYELAGLDDPVELCEVGEVGLAPLKPPKDSDKGRRHAAGGELVLGWRPACGERVPDTQWLLEEKLGEGGFGEVWVARHQWLKDRRVFKFCFRADRVRNLKRELTLFRVLKERVGEHPNIVTVHDVYLDQAPYYLATEYVPGRNLRAWWKEKQRAGVLPDEATRLEVVTQIADALQAAHDAGIIHRDVKPTNILVRERTGESAAHFVRAPVGESLRTPRPQSKEQEQQQGPPKLTAKLADFGIGQVVSGEVLGDMTRLGFTATLASPGSSPSGTQMYMAPELISGKPATIRSDLYSLGVVLYQLLVGDLEQPVTGDWIGEIPDPFLRDDLRRCLAGKPGDRFSSVGQLAERLRTLPARRAAPIRHAAEIAARERAAYNRGVILITALLLLLAVGMRLWQPPFLQSMELAAYDVRARQALKHPPAVATNLGFVVIDDASIAFVRNNRSLGYRYSLFWPRSVYGRLVEELAAQGARAVALDIIFDEPRPDDPPVRMADGSLLESDNFFALQLRRAGNVILAAPEGLTPPPLFLTNALALGDISTHKDYPEGILRRAQAFRVCRKWHFAFRQLEADPQFGVDLGQAHVESGHVVLPRRGADDIKVPLDKEGNFDLAAFGSDKLPPGVARRAKPFTQERLWHMGIVLAAQGLNLNLAEAEVDLPHGRIRLRGPGGVERVIPVDADGYFYIDWCMPPNHPQLTQEAIQDLLSQGYLRLKGQTNDLRNRWQGKLAVYGSTAGTSDLFTDRGATPLNPHTLLVSQYWNVANSILTGRFISHVSPGMELAVIVLLTLAAAVLTWQFRPLLASGLIVLLAASYAALTLFLFVRYRILLSLVIPTFLGLITTHVCLLAWGAVLKSVIARVFPKRT
jgi:serine/threonine protein kinase/class 3 adenylate cyclase